MLLSGLIGVLFGRYLSDKKYFLIIALAIGFVFGIFGEMGVVYPFFIELNPEFTHFELFFLNRSFRLLEIPPLANPPFTVPPIVHIIFVTASVGGVLLGYAIGNKLKPPMRVSD